MRALTALLALSLGCSLEWPRLGPTPCGAAGQRCCEALDDGGAEVAAAGCNQASYCVNSNDSGVGGTCRACPTGRIACDNRCLDPTSDSDHCGSCSNACPLGSRCARTISTDGGVTTYVGVCR